MKNPMIYKRGKLAIVHYSHYSYLMYGKHLINLRAPLRVITKVLGAIRKVFPYFYSIGLRDCDSGGRVFAYYVDWGFNYWHMNKRLERWNGSGDGEVYRQISFMHYLSALRHFKKHGHRD